VAAVLLALAVGGTAVLRSPRPEHALPLAGAATLLAAVAFGRVLSPQFVLWLLPTAALAAAVPLARARLVTGLTAVAWLLTAVEFPYAYWDLGRDADGAAVALVLARNVVLVAAWAVAVAALARVARAAGAVTADPPAGTVERPAPVAGAAPGA
jgi:hypothetical protein